MRALDLSKFTSRVTAGVVNAWCAEGIGLLIVQAHPAGYGQERSIEIVRVICAHRCAKHSGGMPWDAYIYGYLEYSDWTVGACATLDILAAEGFVPREGWYDIEDVDTGKTWTPMQRVDAYNRDLAVFDSWLMAHGRPRAGVYTAIWYFSGYLQGVGAPWADRELWDADYDQVADNEAGWVPYGGWTERRIKQYAGTSVDVVGGLDLDVLSAGEAAQVESGGEDVDAQERTEYEERINGLTQTIGLIAGDLLRPLTRPTAGKYVKTFVDQVRAEADKLGIGHV